MKIKSISLYCIIFVIFCQFLFVSATAVAVSEMQLGVISEHCDKIKDNLKKVQREDSVVRTHIGPYYNTILEKFMKPLNLRLVENNMVDTRLFDNQSNFATAQDTFRNDYNDYQRALEELLLVDCKNEPEKFYDQLEVTREKRQIVNQDVSKMQSLVQEQVLVVNELKAKI